MDYHNKWLVVLWDVIINQLSCNLSLSTDSTAVYSRTNPMFMIVYVIRGVDVGHVFAIITTYNKPFSVWCCFNYSYHTILLLEILCNLPAVCVGYPHNTVPTTDTWSRLSSKPAFDVFPMQKSGTLRSWHWFSWLEHGSAPINIHCWACIINN